MIIFLIILFSYTVIISGERASFIRLISIIFLIIFFTSFIGSLRKKFLVIIGILISIFFFITSQPKLTERLIYHSTDLFLQNEYEDRIDRNIPVLKTLKDEYKKGNIKFTYFSKEHMDHAIISLKMFNNNKLFGYGVKMFRFKCEEKEYYINPRSCTTHSHGIALSFLSEIGLVGFSFLLLIYTYLIKNILKPTKNYNMDKVVLISIFIYLFPLLPSGYFFNNFISMILFTLVGFYLGYKKDPVKS
jgi:O-antigen ligase